MIIGVDIDGVLTDLESYQIEKGREYFKKEIVDINGYDVDSIFGVSKKECDEFWDKYLFYYAREIEVRKDASLVLKRIKERGNKIYIITARTYTDKEDPEGLKMKEAVKKWLLDKKIPYDKLFFSGKDKLKICKENNVSLMIEDSPIKIKQLKDSIPLICFDALYNKRVKGKNIKRVSSWQEIDKIIG